MSSEQLKIQLIAFAVSMAQEQIKANNGAGNSVEVVFGRALDTVESRYQTLLQPREDVLAQQMQSELDNK